MTHELELKARRLIEDAFGKGDMTAIDDVVAPDMIEHEALPPGIPLGAEGLKQAIQMLRSSFSDFRFDIADLAVVGDKVWLRLVGTGTNDGPMMGNPPTGRPASFDVIEIMRFSDGLVVEHWGVADRLGLSLQLAGEA